MSNQTSSPGDRALGVPEQNVSARAVSCDDWLRALFSGTYDLREAEAMRRLRHGQRASPRPEGRSDER
jgi:hypothetical protein